MQHLDDRQHSSTRYQNVQSIDQRIEFVRLVRIHELFRLGRMPLWPAIGNHERTRQFTSEPPGEDDPQSHYFSLFELPGNEHWYRVDYRFLTLLIVDSNSQMAPGFQQYEWLREQLTSSRERFTVVAFHHPPITSGPHGQLLPDGTPREWPMDQGRRFLVPLFEMYGVDLVLNGHDHIYERSYKDGVYYLITGGGGAGLYSINVAPNPYQQVARAVHHYATIDVESSMLTVAAVGVDGEEFDRFTIPVSDLAVARERQSVSNALRQAIDIVLASGDTLSSHFMNILDIPLELKISTPDSVDLGADVHMKLDPGEDGEVRLPTASFLPEQDRPQWRGKIEAPLRFTFVGEDGSLSPDMEIEQVVLLREASYEAVRMDPPVVDCDLSEFAGMEAMVLDSLS